MFKNCFYLLLLLLLMLATGLHANPLLIPKTPAIAAKSYIMVDFDSGKILAEQNSELQVEPASITKLMTAYVIFTELTNNKIQLSDQVSISKNAWQTPGSRMFIKVNSKVSVGDLLKGMIVQSGNDASVALAEHVAGSEGAFATLMNQYAHELGMTKTNFVNSTGLPHEKHLTTAKDLAKLSAAIIRQFPEFYKLYSIREYKYNNINQFNRNLLLWRDKTVDGIKTGHTESAGYCLVASSERNNMRLITIVLGANSKTGRAQESQKLLNFGFRFYETHALFKANEALKKVPVYKSSLSGLDVGLAQTLYVTIPRGEYKALKLTDDIPAFVQGPISKGQELGAVTITLNGKVIAKSALIALQQAPEGSLWQRVRDSMILMFK